MESHLPTPSFSRRPVDAEKLDALVAAGFDPVVARIIAARPLVMRAPGEPELTPSLAQLDNPQHMADMPAAVDRLVKAIQGGECIGLETDHDCDGQTSHAVLYHALVNYFGVPQDRVISFIGHRLEEGYGLSDKVADRILASRTPVNLIITADNGSADEPRIARLKAGGIETIVTDHHHIPDAGIPASAVAVLNPTRDDCRYPDPLIAGCMVAWLFMAATRSALEKVTGKSYPSLASLLDFVAVGTVADCVSMARSRNNRIVVHHGLKRLAQSFRPCWRALQYEAAPTAEDIAFQVAPLLNSDGRLDSALNSVSFLLADTDREAQAWIGHLKTLNQERKDIQRDLINKGMVIAAEQYQKGHCALIIFLDDGHPGVHGIAASKIKDAFGCPTVYLAPKFGNPDLITGSARGVDAFHVQQALSQVAEKAPDLFAGFGGHQGAGGLSFPREKLVEFMTLFEREASRQLQEEQGCPVILTDGPLSADHLSLRFLDDLSVLEPFGREFDAPVFEGQATLQQVKYVGDGTHAKVALVMAGRPVEGIWFRVRNHPDDPEPIHPGDELSIAFQLTRNRFRGRVTLNVQILHGQPIMETAHP